MFFLSKYVLFHQFDHSIEDYKCVLWLDEPMSDLESISIAEIYCLDSREYVQLWRAEFQWEKNESGYLLAS